MSLAYRMIGAVEALEKPAVNDEAQRYRTAAVVTLLLAFPFSTGAAIVFNVAPKEEVLFNVLGFTGIVLVGLSLVLGLVYGRVNAVSDSKPSYRRSQR